MAGYTTAPDCFHAALPEPGAVEPVPDTGLLKIYLHYFNPAAVQCSVMERKYLLSALIVATGIVMAVPMIVMAHPTVANNGVTDTDAIDQLPTMLLEHPSNLPPSGGHDITQDDRGPLQAMAGDGGIPGFIGPPLRDRDEFITFERVPPSDTERADEGVAVYRLSGSDRVRVEVYKGKQPTTGYDVHIAHISKNDRDVTVHVVFKQPKPSAAVDQTPTYPADAAEFELPDGDYTVHVRTMAFEHETADVKLRD